MKPTSDPVTVWLIEDDALFRETIHRLLDSSDEVDCRAVFSSAEQALEALESGFAPEVVLIDIGLPGMNGIEGTRHIKERSPESFVVVLTVHRDDDKIFEAICAGASGYLLKPATAQAIISSIRASREGGAVISPQIAGKVLEMFSRFAVPKGQYGLTAREKEILKRLVDGGTIQGIADTLFVSYHTVDMHIRNIYTKLQVRSRSKAIAKALRERLI